MNGLYELTNGKKLILGLLVILGSGLLMWLLPEQMVVWLALFSVGTGLAGMGGADKIRKSQNGSAGKSEEMKTLLRSAGDRLPPPDPQGSGEGGI